MTQVQVKSNSRERQRINASDGYELNYWTRQLRCSEQELRFAIAVAGPEIIAVRGYLQTKYQHGGDTLACA